MAKNIIYTDSEAYNLGYNDGFNDGQQKSMEEGYNHAVEKAKIAYCQQHCYDVFKGEYCCLDQNCANCGGFDAFVKAIEE